jgi:hypothetical protein
MNCAAENCVNNDHGLCVVESMLSICEDSKCALYQTSPEKQIRVLTKKVEMLTKELKRSRDENEELVKQLDELKKASIYPPVGTVVWVEDCMWGVVPCTIDRPFHYKAGEEGSCTLEGFFTPEDLGKSVFLAHEDWLMTQAEKAEKYTETSTTVLESKTKLDKFIYAKDYE